MDAIDDAVLNKIALISRLKLEGEEKERLKKDLNEILSYVAQISEIQSKGKELYYVRDSPTRRKDARVESGEGEGIRKSFTRKAEEHMAVPKNL
ncbi:hypothetical protein HY993_04130 [Candidatus Micrarchaeota archaeon]|nr:hypothetical protein [Candidatus Micrarchaeota archaeon]